MLNERRVFLCIAISIYVGGCGDAVVQRPPEGEWQSEFDSTAEGRVVRTLSGSVWPAVVHVRHEATIGQVDGDETQVLGQVPSLAMAGDRVYVLDTSLPTVRAYDFSGAHLFDIGREGQGPGEFQQPYLLATDLAGSVYVRDLLGVEAFSSSGMSVRTWTVPGGGIILPMVAGSESGVLTPGRAASSDGRVLSGWYPLFENGAVGELLPTPVWDGWSDWQLEARGEGRVRARFVPYAPRDQWGVTPAGSLLKLAGDRYRLVLADSIPLIIERVVAPVAIPGNVLRALESVVVDEMRDVDAAWRWNANPIPTELPPTSGVTVDVSGRLWVLRAVEIAVEPGCSTEASSTDCLRERHVFDLFLPTGEFLGTIDPGRRWVVEVPVAAREDRFALVVEGPLGVPQVHVFRVDVGSR